MPISKYPIPPEPEFLRRMSPEEKRRWWLATASRMGREAYADGERYAYTLGCVVAALLVAGVLLVARCAP